MTTPESPVAGSATDGIGSKVRRGVAWTMLFRLVERSAGLVSTLILARVLMPQDFGVVAMATSIVALFEILSMADFGSAIIRDPHATPTDYSAAFTLNAMLGLFVAACVLALAIPASNFYGVPEVRHVIAALAVLPILDGFYNIATVDFRKQLQFQKDFVLQVTRKLLAVAVTIPLALYWRNYWALVAGMITGRLVMLVMTYVMHPFRPTWTLVGANKLLKFSRWVILNNGLTYLMTRSSDIVIGRAAGPASLGLFNIAYEISSLPSSELTMPINRAVFPGYAKLMGDKGKLQEAFLRVIGVLAILIIPAGMGVACVADTLVPVVLGAKWNDAIPLVQVLALAGVARALQHNLESVYFAFSRPRFHATLTLVEVAFLIPLMLVSLKIWGLLGAAVACLAAAVLTFPINFTLALRVLGLSWNRVIAVFWRPLVASAAMTALMYMFFGISSAPSPGGASIPSLLLQIVTGAAIYGVLIFGLWTASARPDGAEAMAVDMIQRSFRKKAGPPAA